jgi:NADPH-dependent 7-cyano-7-deazaguanine reductase QueF-like protein
MNGDVDAFKFYVDSFENGLVNSLEIGRRLLNIDVSHGQETVIVRTRL